jgi:hypothetical protein
MTVMMVVPAPPMPAMVVMMMMAPVPAHFRSHLLPGMLLHRRCRARIDQRRACARSTGAATTSIAPTAARPRTLRPRTFVPFIPILLHTRFHVSAVQLSPDGNSLAARQIES